MDSAINAFARKAAFEKISRYSLAIASFDNKQIGTGVLISANGGRFILTAAHVIENADPQSLRFWLRPPAPIVEKAAINTTDAEVGKYSLGDNIPVRITNIDKQTDIAVLEIGPSFVMPEGPELYDIRQSHEFASWPEEKLDGVSLFLFGFPVDNSRPVIVEGNLVGKFLGTASLITEYSKEINANAWTNLSSQLSPHKDFLFKYGTYEEGIEPYGFSGCGVWVMPGDATSPIWRPAPLLVGVSHSYLKKSGLLCGTKLSAIIENV
jgi:hypothetical protein